jgi:hypothetical protein
MDRYVSDPIPHPNAHGDGPRYTRADLVFYDVDPTGDSYHALVYLDPADAEVARDHTTAAEGDRFAGWFTIFGHGGCFGDDERHCAPPAARDPYDLRNPVGIPRQTKTVTITKALATLGADEFRVTVVPVVPGAEGPEPTESLDFSRLSLITYE